MELKTNYEKLKWIAAEVEVLVSDIKDFVERNGITDATRGEMTEDEAKTLTDLITSKLESIKVNKDEAVLEDMITIYDSAINSIAKELSKNAELEDGNMDKYNKETIESFNKVKNLLENSKNSFAGPLKSALDQLVEEKSSGKMDKEYREMQIDSIEVEEENIQNEMKQNQKGLYEFELNTRPEREELEETLRLTRKYFKIKEELEELEDKLNEADLSDDDRQTLEQQKTAKEKDMVEAFKKLDEKYEKDDEYKQQENESNMDYLKRMEGKNGRTADEEANYIVTVKQDKLVSKIKSMNGTVRVYNESTKQFEDIDVKKYIDLKVASKLNNLTGQIKADQILNRNALKKQRDKLDELKQRKENYAKEIKTETQNLPARVPDKEGFFDKLSKRREYYKNSGDSKIKAFFKSFLKKDDEKIFIQREEKLNVPENIRKKFLEALESGMRSGREADEVIRDIKAAEYKNREQEERKEQKQQEDDGPEK